MKESDTSLNVPFSNVSCIFLKKGMGKNWNEFQQKQRYEIIFQINIITTLKIKEINKSKQNIMY